MRKILESIFRRYVEAGVLSLAFVTSIILCGCSGGISHMKLDNGRWETAKFKFR